MFFLKKEPKTLVTGPAAGTIGKSFLLLFFKKEGPFFP
jgi:hypothetical protein